MTPTKPEQPSEKKDVPTNEGLVGVASPKTPEAAVHTEDEKKVKKREELREEKAITRERLVERYSINVNNIIVDIRIV